MIKVIPHGPLAKYPSFEVAADSAAEAITAWSNQTDLANQSPLLNPVVDAIGFDTVEKLEARTRDTEIHLIPRMTGGSGSVGKILLGAVFIGIGFATAGLGWSIGGVLVSPMLVATGIGLMIGGIMQLFMKAPSLDAEDGPDASKILGASNNTTQIGTPIPRGYGRCRAGGQYLSVQVNASSLVYGEFPETVG